MTYNSKIINKAIDDGCELIVLEPKEVFDSAVKEFRTDINRLVYDVELLLECLADNYDWDAIQTLEWFDYNVFDLTFMKGGPIFYDPHEKKYLTIDQ